MRLESLRGVAGELGEEVLGAGAGDGAEVRDEVLLVHADAGVGDGEGLLLFVEFEVDARRVDAAAGESLVLVVDEGEVAELIERVGGVGDELAEEDLRVRVERMDDEVEELAYFGLELLFGHGMLIIAGKWGRNEGGLGGRANALRLVGASKG